MGEASRLVADEAAVIRARLADGQCGLMYPCPSEEANLTRRLAANINWSSAAILFAERKQASQAACKHIAGTKHSEMSGAHAQGTGGWCYSAQGGYDWPGHPRIKMPSGHLDADGIAVHVFARVPL